MNSTPTAPSSHSRIPGIDGLRAISILLVIFSHFEYVAWSAGPPASLQPYLRQIGQIGVDLFFVISGYLITRLLLIEKTKTGSISLTKFYARRALRILPPFFAFLITMVILKTLGIIQVSAQALFTAVTFSLNYWIVWALPSEDSYRAIGHIWSLCVEEQFYLLWPLLLVLLSRRARSFALISLFAAPVIRFLGYKLIRQYSGNNIAFHARFDLLMFGALLSFLENEPWIHIQFQRIKRFSPAWVALAFLVGVQPFLCIQYSGRYHWTLGYFLEGSAALVMLMTLVYARDSFFTRVLECPPAIWIGRISYSLYLWQQLFMTGVNDRLTQLFPGTLVPLFLIAALSYFTIEKMALRYRPS